MSTEIREVEDINYQIDSAINDQTTLGQLSNVIENNELSETSQQIAEIAIEALYDRLGIQYTQVATESFGSDIKDKLIKIWKAIKTAFAKMWEMIVNFFDNYLSGLEGIKRYNERVKEKLKNFKPNEDAPNDFKDNLLSIAFISPSVYGMVKGIHNSNINAKYLLDIHILVTRHIMSGLPVIEHFIKKFSNPGLFNKDEIKKAADEYYNKITVKTTVGTLGEQPIVLIYGLTIDIVREDKLNYTALDFFSRTGDVHKVTHDLSHYVQTLSDHEMKQISAQVDDLLKLCTDFQNQLPKYKSLNKEFSNIIDNMISYLNKNETNINSIDAKSMEYSFKSFKNIAIKTITVMPKVNLQACKMGIRYIDKSIDAHMKASVA